MHNQRPNTAVVDLGDEDPLYTRNISKGPPDRRRVSLRWLAGSVLTGIFSTLLLGGALQAAVGLDEDLVVRPVLASRDGGRGPGEVAQKGDRVRPVPESRVTRRVIQISTVTRKDDRDLVRVRPYAHIHATLAAPVPPEVTARVPAFNPLDIFSAESEPQPAVAEASSDAIYGAEVDGEVDIKVSPFPLDMALLDENVRLADEDAEDRVREAVNIPDPDAGETESALSYVDPGRFEFADGRRCAVAVDCIHHAGKRFPDHKDGEPRRGDRGRRTRRRRDGRRLAETHPDDRGSQRG